jgi:hypothetical protein
MSPSYRRIVTIIIRGGPFIMALAKETEEAGGSSENLVALRLSSG